MDAGMTRILLVAGLLSSWVAAQPQRDEVCSVVRQVSPLPGMHEASGVAISRRTPGLIWVINDSGDPLLFAFDAAGAAKGRVQVTGVQITDWEDLAIGPCAEGSCLYIADVGDNNGVRREITIYRVPEPRPEDKATPPAERWAATYPDGARDAEGVFVTPAGQLFVVSKDAAGATALYRLPQGAAAGRIARLEMVSKLPVEEITGAATSPNGEWVALRTNFELLFYRTRDLATGAQVQPRRFDVRPLREPQGEGVAIGPDGLVYVVGEQGSGGGTLATLRCTLR